MNTTIKSQVSNNKIVKIMNDDPHILTNKNLWLTIHFRNGKCTRPVPDETTTIREIIMGANRLQNFHHKMHEMAIWVAVLGNIDNDNENEQFVPDLEKGINFDEPAQKYIGCNLYFDSKFNMVPKFEHTWRPLTAMESFKKANVACRHCFKSWSKVSKFQKLICIRCSIIIHKRCVSSFMIEDEGCDKPASCVIPPKEYNHEWQIRSHDIKLKEQIGKGAYGTVYKCNWFGDHAVKVLNMNDMEKHEDLINEMKLLHKAKHSNILLFVGFCNAIYIESLNETRPGMVTEYCPGKTLYS